MHRLTAILFLVLVAAAPASAGQLTPADLERVTNFAQRMQAVYEEGMALSFDLDGAEDYIESFHAGEMEQAEFTTALDPFLDSMDASVADFRARYPRAPSPPSIGSEIHERSLSGLAAMVVGLGDQLDRQLAVLYRLREAALAGDDDAYDTASADSMALAGEMIMAENVSLEGSLVAIAPGHPQQGLIKAIIGGNEAMAVALRVVEASLRGADFDAGEFALGVETSLRDAGRGIVEGEKAARQMLKNLEGKFAATETDRYSARFIGEFVKAYERAFVIERDILEAERDLLDYLRAVNAGTDDPENALEAITEFQAELEEQSSRRLEEQNIRLEMAAEFARTVQTMQN
jgi:hypothetical protein